MAQEKLDNLGIVLRQFPMKITPAIVDACSRRLELPVQDVEDYITIAKAMEVTASSEP